MRALYMLLILTVIGDVFERTIVDAKPYEVERDSNPSSGRNLKNSLLNNIEENHYNIKHNYDDYYKICRRCNNYANDNDDDDDDDISTTDNPIDSDDSDDIDIIDDIDDIVDIDDFLSDRDPKNNLQNNIEENDNNNNKLDHVKGKKDGEEDDDDFCIDCLHVLLPTQITKCPYSDIIARA
ncbi:PREDICTED: putative uncharacterized protein DDB_G0275317 isoform X2 [Acromyrmex echinatior]|uniref:putative uncharacterized protein DDB_G0275317 isoform X2 n=1 Tax=Acromyrmex echinatior TaxID=103372 RepID=UPI000580EEF4|nr:PREDICTED: putative uncharacterized protein DDB_G0275317 isoform X2 [Acromyrmex echinatior]